MFKKFLLLSLIITCGAPSHLIAQAYKVGACAVDEQKTTKKEENKKEDALSFKEAIGFSVVCISVGVAWLILVKIFSKMTNPNGQNPNNLREAIEIGDIDKIKKLLKEKSELIDAPLRSSYGAMLHDETPLQYAVKRGNAEVVRTLIRAGASLNVTNHFNEETPLIRAILSQPKIASLLIQEGADVDTKSGWGNKCPVSVAIDSGNCDILRQLIEKNAQLNTNCCNHTTPLHYSIESGRYEATELLVNAGANVNATDNQGRTPLIVAVRQGQTKIVAFLVKKDVDVTIKDSSGKSALDYAAGNKEMRRIISGSDDLL